MDSGEADRAAREPDPTPTRLTRPYVGPGADVPGRDDPYPVHPYATEAYPSAETYPADLIPSGPYAPRRDPVSPAAPDHHRTADPYPSRPYSADPYADHYASEAYPAGPHPAGPYPGEPQPAGSYGRGPVADPGAPGPYGGAAYGGAAYGRDAYSDPYRPDAYGGQSYAAESSAGGSGGAPAYPRERYGPDGPGDWRDALPLIDPPPLRPSRPRRMARWWLPGSAGRTGATAGAAAGHRPSTDPPAWRDWLDEHRQEVGAVLAVLAAVGVVAMLVLRAVEVPPPVTSTEDLATRASSIPYTEATDGANRLPPVPAGSAVLPPFQLPELPQPSVAPAPTRASVPPRAPAPQPPGADRPRPTTSAKPPAAPPPRTQPARGDRDAYSTLQAESYDAQSGTQTEGSHDRDGGSLVGYIAAGDWLRYRGVDFGATPATGMRIRVASGAPGNFRGRMNIRLDSRSNPPIGGITVGNSGDWYAWHTIGTSIRPVTGVHTVYVTFDSDHDVEYMNLNWFTFTR